MPEEALDFWPDISSSKPLTPLSIMKKQAILLGKHTNNLLEAEVETNTLGADLTHRFVIVVPALDYRYELFRVQHNAVKLYPVLAGPVGGNAPVQIADEEAFVNWLRKVLSSDHVKHILGSLLAQAES